MKTIIFATHNRNKAKEIAAQCGGNIAIKTLGELGFDEEISETESTLEGNALLKARCIHAKFGQPCFADDTGLEVDALDGRPGVYSARFAGAECNAEKNMAKLLGLMEGKLQRTARFRTVIAYIAADGREHLFEGAVEGTITTQKSGTDGFGYDPIFVPDQGDGRTFAQMTLEQKNKISHRARAVKQLVDFLNDNE